MMYPLLKVVANHFPTARRYFHQYRDERKSRRPRKTRHGFLLADPHGMFFTDRWEVNELSTFCGLLTTSSVVIDIGANVGYYSCLAAACGKKVIAIEPLQQNLMYLYRNLIVNGFADVEVHPVGLGAEPRIQEIYGRWDVASFVKGWISQNEIVAFASIMTLDAVLRGRFSGEQITIKLDVEGFEAEVLRGAAAVLAMNPKPSWIVESILSPSSASSFSYVFKTFFANGYRAKQIGPVLNDVSSADVKRWLSNGVVDGACNFLFTASEQEKRTKPVYE